LTKVKLLWTRDTKAIVRYRARQESLEGEQSLLIIVQTRSLRSQHIKTCLPTRLLLLNDKTKRGRFWMYCVYSCCSVLRDYLWPPAKQRYKLGSVCLSVCQMITIESLDVGSSYLHTRSISREYGSDSYMNVIGSRSRSQEQRGRKSLFRQTSLVSNSGSIKHRTVKFACSMGFSAVMDRMARPPSLSRDRKW